MSYYDVGKAFARIEREIIASMMRNMDHHRTEEDKEGKKWPQWQAMQLKSLEKFKRDNRKKYDFTKINSTIDGLIQEAYDKGGMEEEIRILKQIKRLHGNSVTNVVKAKISDIKQRLTPGVNQEFFGLNREKVDKLIKATHSDMEKVEHAMLRRADDQYRKIIFNAQMADISGAFTYEQAVDMAAKDFLNAGLNCVEYKNGRRVTAKTYAEMAIRTANARATLMAEGDKRHQLGITTVIVGHNGSACPLCAKWLGKVLIDDVYSGGKPSDGDYPLLSTAMKEGLFHPNCRDVIGTYIPGITRLPEPPKPEERQLSFDVYNLEQKEKQAKHNAERMGRLGDNSLDKNNKRMYKHREKMWKEKAIEYARENVKVCDDFYKDKCLDVENKKTILPLNLNSFSANYGCKDVTSSILKNANKRTGLVGELNEVTIEGVKYVVDGKYVVLRPNEEEKHIAKLLSSKLGHNVMFHPQILMPENMSTPDYLVNGEGYDLKSLSGSSKNLIYNAIKGKGKQAKNFIIDVTKSPLEDDNIYEQAEKLYSSSHMLFLDTLVIIRDDEIVKILKRK